MTKVCSAFISPCHVQIVRRADELEQTGNLRVGGRIWAGIAICGVHVLGDLFSIESIAFIRIKAGTSRMPMFVLKRLPSILVGCVVGTGAE